MKKKIFLITAMIALLACVFAISASAENEVTLVTGEKVDFETVFKVQNADGVDNVVTGYNTGYNSNSVTDVIFPDYIAGIKSNGLFGKYATSASTTIKTLTFETSDELFIHGVNMFTGCSVEKVTFNPNCVVEIRDGNFSGCTSLTEITFPKFLKLASGTFSGCTNMVPTNELVFAEGMTEIAANAFNQCSRLTGTVVFPSTLKSIGEAAFKASSITGVDFSKCASLDTLVKSIFVNCDSLTAIDMSACTSLTSLSNSFAENCDNLVSVILPPNLETINEKSFAWCGKLQSMVIPASCTLIGVEAFQYARHNQDLKVFTLYIQSNVNFDTSRYSVFNSSSAKVEFILIGENVTAESFKAANTYAHVTGATVVDYLAENSKWTYVPGQSISNHTIVENYCTPLALTNSHSATDAICNNTDLCSYCGYITCTPHTGEVSIAYPNGYDTNGEKKTCSLAICGGSKSIEIKPIFTSLGYSVGPDGYSLKAGFTINIDAVKEYKELYPSFTFGAVIVNANTVSSKDAFFVNGVINPSAKGLMVCVEDLQYSILNVDISNFSASIADSLELVVGLYTNDGEGNMTVAQYINTENYPTAKTYSDMSLNAVTLNQARLAHGMPALVPPTPNKE